MLGKRMVRGVVAPAIAAAALAITSIAWACTSVDGFTWYSDNSWYKSGSSGTNVTIKATGAKTNTDYYMISGEQDGHGHACIGNWVLENATAVTSNGSGAIANTSGTIDRGVGEWDVCFVTTDIDTTHPQSITAPVTFEVV